MWKYFKDIFEVQLADRGRLRWWDLERIVEDIPTREL